MSLTWNVILASYRRLPKTTQYQMSVKVDEVTQDEKNKLTEKQVEIHLGEVVEMEEIVTKIHKLLQKYPAAKVLMKPLPSVEPQYGAKERIHELEASFVKILKDDLDEALKMFAPIERVVMVKPVPPRLKTEEMSNA